MIGRGVVVSLHGTWGGRRPLILVAMLAIMWRLMPYRNPWDMLASGTSGTAVALLMIPCYLFLLNRDLRHPWESLVGTRLGSGGRWWIAQILAAGCTAAILTGAMMVLFLVVSLVTQHWSWHWGHFGPFLVGQHVMATWRPWWWSLNALGLMTLGLWATGGLWTVLAVWWRSGWTAWFVVLALSLAPLEIMYSTARFGMWLLPGPQFAWVEHGAFAHSPPPAWSVGYAVILLVATTILGWRLMWTSPWDARHGGPMS